MNEDLQDEGPPVIVGPRGPMEDRRGWHIEKSFSVGNILTAMAMVSTAFYWGSGVDKQLAVHEAQIRANADSQKTAGDSAQQTRIEIRGDLQDINRKLDRVIERSQGVRP